MFGYSFDKLPMYSLAELLQLEDLTMREKKEAEKLAFGIHKCSYQYNQPLPDLDLTPNYKTKVVISKRNKIIAQKSQNIKPDPTQRQKYVINFTPIFPNMKKQTQPIVKKVIQEEKKVKQEAKKETKPIKYSFEKVFMYDFDQLMELNKLTKEEQKKAFQLEFREFKELCPIESIENLPELDYTPIKKVKPQIKKRVTFKENTPGDWILVPMH